MKPETIRAAGILLVVLPTVVYGGVSLLRLWLVKQDPRYTENPLRQRLWRAGHAHAGVLLILSLALIPYAEHADLPGAARTFARSAVPIAAILMPAAFFLSVARGNPDRPNGLIRLAYLGALMLVAGVLTLGVGLLRAA